MHPEQQNQPSPASPSGAADGPSTTASARLVGSTGADRPATPGDVAERLQAEGFFWLDLENPDENELAEFCQSLQLSGAAVGTLTHASQRSSFARAAGSVQAVLPASVDTRRRGTWLEANYVTLVLTEQFLLTVHASPCAPLQHARNQYCSLDDEHARTDGVRLLFLVADVLVGSFRPQLLAIDDRLGEIQLDMLRGVSRGVHDELVKILGVLTETIQELGWYGHDLEDIAEMVDRLPGMRSDAQQHFDHHSQRVTRMQENTKNIRDEAKDALTHYSENVAGRQAQVINALTIVATVFLPLSFLTGYFGMNFRILTDDVQTTLWQFILLGVLLMIASAAVSLLNIRWIERRLGIRQMWGPPS
jgi:Mg2+ and Co2+ transporter CorA